MSNCYKYYKRDAELKVTRALAHQILRSPIVTEKALKIGAQGYVSFIVGSEFNKIQIRKAFSLIYEGLISEVLKVNIINQKGKIKRNAKRAEFKKSDYKKAMILVKVKDNGEELMNTVYGGNES